MSRRYGRYGYRRGAALLRDAGWQVNDRRVERLWKREGLEEPMKQPEKGRLWLDGGSSCPAAHRVSQSPLVVRLRASSNSRWPGVQDIEHSGRTQPGMSLLGRFGRAKSPAEQRDDTGEAEAELDRGHRRADRSVYLTRRARLHQVRQRTRVHCRGRQGLDQGRRGQDGLHRASIAAGKRILRKLQPANAR